MFFQSGINSSQNPSKHQMASLNQMSCFLCWTTNCIGLKW
jgi:hypothetical protein